MKPCLNGRHKTAFSLVELSIVLVILGLLVGGVLAGQSLIRAAQLRSVNTEYQRWNTAAYSFRDKYFALPGDMSNATNFWGLAGGTAAANDSTCGNTVSTDQRTCNGDGDGHFTTGLEIMRFWQHLVNAGLIEGRFDGSMSGANFPSSSLPPSKAGNGVYWFLNADMTTPNSGDLNNFNNIPFGTNMMLIDGSTGNISHFLTPAEAWNIDTKIDDGLPGTGKIISYKGQASYPCTDKFGQAADTGANYNLSVSTPVCGLYFVKLFGS